MAPQLRHATAARVALAAGGEHATSECAGDAARALAERGLSVEAVDLDAAPELAARVIAYAPAAPPSPALAARVARICERAALAGRPVVLLASYPRQGPDKELESACALAYLRSYGAIACADPDVWLETIALIAAYGVPSGPRLAVVAPPGTWVAASASALAREAHGPSSRPPEVACDTAKMGAADIALVAREALSPPIPDRVGMATIVPVTARAELLGEDRRPTLVGLRAALGAATAAGQYAERLAAGLGPAELDAAEIGAISPDRDRFDRQLANLGQRAGDHETKVLLASYGIDVTRQAVATTPSAATRIAKKAGYPVEVKPWGPDLPGEPDGCPVEGGLTTAAEVRRAFASVAREAELPDGTPVIVREAPPRGRDVSARIERVGPLGWMTILEVAGAPAPAASPAPLRHSAALELASLVEATRAGDPAPDREALADTLVRASFMAVDRADVIERLDLHRIIVFGKGDGAVVADAHTELRDR